MSCDLDYQRPLASRKQIIYTCPGYSIKLFERHRKVIISSGFYFATN